MTERPRRSYLVFISHSTKDRWIARQMAAIVQDRGRQQGIVTFLDEKDIEGGDDIPRTILQKLRASEEFVVLLSPQSVNRPWVLIELGAAWGLGKRLTAIIDKVAPKEMPDIIAQTKAYDLNDFDRFVTELLRRAERKAD
jgi:TIR domain